MGLSRRQLLSSATLLGAAVLGGCTTRVGGEAQPNPDDLRRITETPPPPTHDTVSIGIIAFEPYTEGTGAQLKGPIPDVARKILTDMGVPAVKFLLLNQQDMVLAAMAAGRIDIAGGLVLTPASCHGLKFSEPDFVSGTAFAVPAGNPKGLRTFADVAAQGAKVAVVAGSPEKTDALRGGAKAIVEMPEPNAILQAVRNGQADCFAFDDITLRHMVKTIGQGLEVAAPFMPDGRLPFVGAYAFQENTTLLDDFNDGLKKLHDSGEWLRMVTPFDFTENNAPPADLTAEKACVG
ncbi:transporter substrate-binding domain-containing protein [Actinophytocola oryzae]|uniref:Polar amino acid transport system substrate-binding protein n=1 Tax=Actinophytocola oryzae TaxID=502181 RepID=A0A4R7VVV3_9PSEU|nr:transporter substrate-binding domain-containing protein [Actinophytocola oryzae]TDV54012.1 polar amino acid transport system substrate-binding protein [Actinophytocola oryzae]